MGIKFERRKTYLSTSPVTENGIDSIDPVLESSSIVKLSPNGTATIEKGEELVFLGRYKEKNVRKVFFDISDLMIEEVKISQIMDHYEPSLVCIPSNPAQELDVPNIVLTNSEMVQPNYIVFTITEDITAKVQDFQIIFKLVEKKVTIKGNIKDKIEWFTSSAINARVYASFADEFEKGTLIDLTIEKEGLLQKPLLDFTWNNNRDLQLKESSSAILGYTQDKFITELKAAKNDLVTDSDAKTYLVLLRNDGKIAYNHLMKAPLNNSYLTQEVTSKPSDWYIFIAIKGSNQTAFSDSFSLKVFDNKLNGNEVLRTSKLLHVKSADEKVMEAQRSVEGATYYTLGFKGVEVDNLLTTLNNIKNDGVVLDCGTSN